MRYFSVLNVRTTSQQGFPDWNPPDFVVAAAQKALSQGFHQYTRTAGHPRLVQLLAKRYSKHFGRDVDPFSQVRNLEALPSLWVFWFRLVRNLPGRRKVPFCHCFFLGGRSLVGLRCSPSKRIHVGRSSFCSRTCYMVYGLLCLNERGGHVFGSGRI